MYTEWREEKVMIWGKTYPELSTKYRETVCTGGVLENGNFIRLYPIPYRYLSEDTGFSKYQWIKAKIRKSDDDNRPESFKINPDTIELLDKVPSDKFGWFGRLQLISKNVNYHFDDVDKLKEANRKDGTSIGFIKPKEIISIYLDERPQDEYKAFQKKFEENEEKSKQIELFGLDIGEVKKLQFISKRFMVEWKCNALDCTTHKMSILDWEAYELLRKIGETEALNRLQDILLSEDHNISFFLSNFKLHPTAFAISGLWYPKNTNLAPNLSLF
jgi:hypothetical protein